MFRKFRYSFTFILSIIKIMVRIYLLKSIILIGYGTNNALKGIKSK